MKRIIVCLAILMLGLVSCEKEKEDLGNISFAANYHIINCPATVSIYVDDVLIGDLSKFSNSIKECGLEGNLTHEVAVGEHSYKVLVKCSEDTKYTEISGKVNVKENECEKVFIDLSK